MISSAEEGFDSYVSALPQNLVHGPCPVLTTTKNFNALTMGFACVDKHFLLPFLKSEPKSCIYNVGILPELQFSKLAHSKHSFLHQIQYLKCIKLDIIVN